MMYSPKKLLRKISNNNKGRSTTIQATYVWIIRKYLRRYKSITDTFKVTQMPLKVLGCYILCNNNLIFRYIYLTERVTKVKCLRY